MSIDQPFLKNKTAGFYLLTVLYFLFFNPIACIEKTVTKKPERSFYYWKSVLKLNPFELSLLDSLNVKTIYLKFFDVDWEPVSRQAIPLAKLQVPGEGIPFKFNIVPTVFITNACVQNLDSSQTASLAGKIYGAIKDISEINRINYTDEIQIDCDWTVSTQKKYFALLWSIKQLSKKQISATIRLHQIKFLSRTGVPPADKGLLMCYNMGNLKNPATSNSILETRELLKYTRNLSSYPLPLDVAFPLFEWKVLFRNNAYKGLIENLPANIFTEAFTSKKDNRLEILKDTLLSGYDLKKGDILRCENSDIAEILAAANVINEGLKNTHPRISLYHLDSVTLKKYSTHELEGIYNSFH